MMPLLTSVFKYDSPTNFSNIYFIYVTPSSSTLFSFPYWSVITTGLELWHKPPGSPDYPGNLDNQNHCFKLLCLNSWFIEFSWKQVRINEILKANIIPNFIKIYPKSICSFTTRYEYHLIPFELLYISENLNTAIESNWNAIINNRQLDIFIISNHTWSHKKFEDGLFVKISLEPRRKTHSKLKYFHNLKKSQLYIGSYSPSLTFFLQPIQIGVLTAAASDSRSRKCP